MADCLTSQQRHLCMSSIHSSSTKPEVKLRKELWSRGYRYRINDKRLPGSPDIVLPKYRSVVFIHGCFWHGHKDCPRYVVPKTNTEFWVNKVKRNQERDEEKWRQLEAKGWFVVIVWECELKKMILDSTISRVEQELIGNRASFLRHNEERARNRQQRLAERKEQKNRRNLLVSEIKGIVRG